jgi:superfamily II DNA or RNA helicase
VENRLRLRSPCTWRVASAGDVRSCIAGVVLGRPAVEAQLGSVSLYRHQLIAADRLQFALERFNGALLCDDVGMGKTYVAISLARRFRRCLVVCPAAITSMWQAALTATDAKAELATFEALSRADSERRRRGKAALRASYDFVIVDEAHHARNPRTNRYFALASLVRGAKVLLLTATPIHNRRGDLVALLSLFLGSRATAMTSGELALCVVRRDQNQLEQRLHIPAVLPVTYHDVSDDRALVEQLMDLPPPVPLRDGGLAGALIGRGLVHQWASSEAALQESLKRRIARSGALCASLEAGTYPTARELETWIYGDGALQLGFAQFLAAPVVGHDQLLASIRTHLAALEEIRARFPSQAVIDAERSRIVAAIRGRRSNAKVVAFAQYTETVSMLFRRLAHAGKVAMLTSHGARVAGGSLTRTAAISRFAPRATRSAAPPPSEVIDVLLTTDLLSEGVNLQDADTVIHLDLPWTVARMEQRVGRVARLDSRHDDVFVHVLRPPASVAKVLAQEWIVRRKWALAKNVIGTSAPNPVFETTEDGIGSAADSSAVSPLVQAERLRTMLESWARAADDPSETASADDSTIVATANGSASGFVAAISAHGISQLLVGYDNRVTGDLPIQIGICADAGNDQRATDPADAERAIEMIQRWWASQQASAAAGLGASNALRRREIISRIDTAIESAPPHLRTSRVIAAARAREIATAPQCAAVERELETLLQSNLPPDAWLDAIASLDATAGQSKTHSTDPLRIHAILQRSDRS